MNDVPVRPAATLVVLREASDGLETLLLHRNRRLSFGGGQWVFPGGAVEPADEAGSEEQTARRAAVRETREECGLQLPEEALVPVSHWTTPRPSPKRYATWFFAASLTADADRPVQVDGGEIVQHAWYRPAQALAAHQAGDIQMLPPTYITLHALAEADSVDAALTHWRRQPMLRIEPRIAVEGDTVHMLYPGDAGYASGEASRPGPRHRCILGPAGWRYQRHDGSPTDLIP